MRALFIVGWLFLGLAGVIFHFGPGQEHMEVDRINSTLNKARKNVSLENYQTALLQFDEVLADLPPEKTEVAQRVLLEKTKTQMMSAQLPEARETLETLLNDLRSNEGSDPELVADVQSTLANAQYYRTWLMRLEGLPEEEWMPEIEAARQHYTELNTKASSRGDGKVAERAAQDLESAIRLARMDLQELKALPLPSQ